MSVGRRGVDEGLADERHRTLQPIMPDRFLLIRDEHGKVQALPIDTARAWRIGRSESADVRLEHEHISRLHARLTAGQDHTWWIEDLASRNGTWLDGSAIDRPTQLYNQQVVQLGPFDLWLQSTPEPTDQLPVHHTIDRLVTSVYDEDESTIQHATEAMAGIDLSVLNRLHELSLSLAETASVARRMDMVCAFVHAQSRLVRLCAVLGVQSNDPDTVHVLHASTDDPARQPYISRTLLRQVLRERRPMFMSTRSGGDADRPLLSIVEQRRESLAAFACPMLERAGGPVLYVLFAADSCDPFWQSLLQLVVSHYRHADTLGRLVDQARIDRELKTAREIQLGLVPTDLERLPLDVAIGFRPCHEVGGDYADALELPDGRVLIALADVTGKGMPAAMLSSSVHTLVHTVADAGGTLVEIAHRLNRYLMRFAPMGSFVTGVLLIIDPATGGIEVINAGHMPPLIACDKQGIRAVAQAGFMPFGIDEQAFERTTDQLQPGQRIVLYSDGLSELATPTGEMPGMEGVEQALANHTTGPAADTAKAMETWVQQLAGDTAQSDDQTLVVARLRASR